MSSRAVRSKLNATLFAFMLRALFDGPCSAKDLIDVTGFSRETMVRHLRIMHEQGALHVDSWERAPDGRQWCPVYALGHLDDVPKPKPLTKQERNAADRQRHLQRIVLATRTPTPIYHQGVSP